VLYRLDPATYQAATAARARSPSPRRPFRPPSATWAQQELVAIKFVSQQAYGLTVTLRQNGADLTAAATGKARINLAHQRSAPITGRIGKSA
jgi:hypothetical protein